MKHAHGKYDRIQDPENLIPKDEPVFLIRAQDDIGWAIVRMWAIMRECLHGHDQICEDIYSHAEKMKDWPKKKRAG